MLKGEHGYQRKEVDKLASWLSSEIRPEIVNLTNVLLSGLVHDIKARNKAKLPIIGTLQGDDIFLEMLPEPYKTQALDLVRQHCRTLDGFIATSAYYADFMAEYLQIERARIDVVHPGINLKGFGVGEPSAVKIGEPSPVRGRSASPLPTIQPLTGLGSPISSSLAVGYFARICPEKGLHVLVEAVQLLKKIPGSPPCRLRVAGWLGENNHGYLNELVARIRSWGWIDDFEHVDCPDHASKLAFLQSLDVLSVPTIYREPKGLYILEALASGVPVVQPRHGSFPELIEATGGGLLVNPNDPAHLAQTLCHLLDRPALRQELGEKGRQTVHERFHAAAMAERTINVYRKYLS